MTFKKIFMLICVVICLFAMASVCANDADMLMQSGNGTQEDTIGLDDVYSQESSEDNSYAASFTDLQSEIDKAEDGEEIVLNSDYALDSSENPIKISKSITLKGNGSCTLNGNGVGRIADIGADEKSIIFENLIFKNGKESEKGGAILNTYSKTSLTFINCKFDYNYVEYYGGAVYSDGDLTFNDCEFSNNYAGVDGGAIYGCGETTVNNSDFTKNNAKDAVKHKCTGGAIHNKGHLYVSNSYFEKNFADIYGGAIYCEGQSTIALSEFRNNEVSEFCKYEYFGTYHVGGALYCGGKCTIDSCIFNGNLACEIGGAIFAEDNLIITRTSYYKNETSFQSNNCWYFGGAICVCKDLYINWDTDSYPIELNSNYYHSYLLDARGGAIYCLGNSYINNTVFTSNHGTVDGGAIYCDGKTRVMNSKFNDNNVDGLKANFERVYGGAICSKGLITLENCSFDGNYAKESDSEIFQGHGGAVYAYDEIEISDCTFKNNYAECGGAIFARVINKEFFNSTFIGNKATGDHGGAIYLDDNSNPIFRSCRFEDNHCPWKGGAIYIDSRFAQSEFSKCTFNDNTADCDGGAIYSFGILTVSDSEFKGNKAKGKTYQRSFGGAIYTWEFLTVDNCRFENNYAYNLGGAICSDFNMKLTGSSFEGNSAECAGAIYTGNMETVSNSVFIDNEATTDDGGAIYVDEACTTEFISCSFSGNKAYNRGGAIYTDEIGFRLKVSYCSFVDNHAAAKKYSGGLVYRGPGHSIFNSGYYNSLDKVWMGSNSPSFKGEFVEYHTWASDEDHTPKSYLKIGMKINETEFFVGNTYETTVYFYTSNGKSLSSDILHSTCNFTGAAEFSNIKSDVNDMTADAKMLYVEGLSLYGKLDHQEVSIFIDVKNKYHSDVHIVSCEDVRYPNQIKVNYEISNRSDEAFYIIKDSLGNIVKQKKLGSANTLSLGPFKPGSYTLTIIDPETRTTLASSDNATFNISKGDMDLNIVIFNESYGDISEVILHSNAYDSYNYILTVIGENTGYVLSKTFNFTDAYRFVIGELDADNYEAEISFGGNEFYNPISKNTRFVVHPDITSFELEITSSEISYGGNATVIPVFKQQVTGNITYYLHNGTFIAKLPVNENLTLSGLDAGFYVIIANYSGDNDYLAAFDSTNITVKQVKPVFDVVSDAREIKYNETVTVSSILPDKATGTVICYLSDGTRLGEFAVGDSFVMPILDVGEYVIVANYSGDRNYLPASDSTNITVKQVKPVFEVVTDESEIYYSQTVTVSSILPDGATGTVTYYFSDGTRLGEFAVEDSFILPILDAGVYVIVAKYSGDLNFENATANTTLTISKDKTEIMADAITMLYTANEDLVITLKTIKGDPVAGVNVTVVLNGVKNYTTDEKGQINLSTYNFDVNVYDVVIIFNGNKNYMNSSKTTYITVNKMPSKITAAPLTTTYKIQKELVINLKDDLNNPICNLDVYITINGVTHKCKTDGNGNARIIIGLPPNQYTAKVTFSDANYGSATAHVKVTVLKAKPKITAKKKTFKKAKKVKKYTVAVKFNGKPVSNLKLTLKIKGKTYKAKTNKKGKATFKIKKLTKKGIFKAKITFKGNNIYKKVTKTVKITIK